MLVSLSKFTFNSLSVDVFQLFSLSYAMICTNHQS